MPPAPFEIVAQEGQRIATNGAQTLSLLGADGRLFRRRAMKVGNPETATSYEWAVAELDGVRVYFDGTNVVVTRENLYP